jgi:hypothetical protein
MGIFDIQKIMLPESVIVVGTSGREDSPGRLVL